MPLRRRRWIPGPNGNPDQNSDSLQEILLRVAAYRATHGGEDPPPNSLLAMEKDRLLSRSRRLFELFRRWRRPPQDYGRPLGRPLRPWLVERSFLTDDFTEEDVIMRLEAWPVVTAYRSEGRVHTGEWFTYTIEVKAESRKQARFIVDCIFAVECPQPAEDSGNPTLPEP